MKLYEIPKGSKIKLLVTDGTEAREHICTFNHVDGMYSNITTEDGDTVHLMASTELKKVGDVYEIGKEEVSKEDTSEYKEGHNTIHDEFTPVKKVGNNRYLLADGRVLSRQAIHSLRTKKRLKRPIAKRNPTEYKISKSVKILLAIKDVSMRQLAEGAGITYITINHIVTGRTINPHISNLCKIAEFFDVSVETLLGVNERYTALYESERLS